MLGAALCFGGTRFLARLTTVPFAVLGPGLVVVMLLGAFQDSGQLGDLWVMIALGVFGWLLKATDYPRAPFLIGFVLAVPLERYYFLTDSVYDGASWLLRPWVLVFLVILIAPLVLAGIRRLRARRHIDVDDTDRGAPPAEEAGSSPTRAGRSPSRSACSPFSPSAGSSPQASLPKPSSFPGCSAPVA